MYCFLFFTDSGGDSKCEDERLKSELSRKRGGSLPIYANVQTPNILFTFFSATEFLLNVRR